MWVLLPEQIGVPNFVLRYFQVPPHGASGYGKHPYEHEIFVVTGQGVLKGRTLDGQPVEQAIRPGDAAFIAPNEEHQFRNEGDEPLGMVCVVPKGCE
ncbi:MAG: cupin domain-containing protein [Planctomycetes bacterium]|nr:cupin domain-containing protein [Planctomycetota bacterium]